MTNPSSILPRWSFAIAAVALVVAACSGGSPTPTPEPTTSASPAPLTPTTPAAEDYIPPSNPTAGAPDDSAEPEGSEVPAGRLVYVGSDGHIYVINADGSERTRISEQAADDAPTAHTWPMWSGHGESVVFSQVVGGAGGPRFFLRSTTVGEGAGPRLVYENPRETGFIGQSAPHYTNGSPDGRWLAFLAIAGDITLFIDGAAEEAETQAIAQGAPLYYAWTNDAASLLIHLRSDLMLFRPDSGEAPALLDLPSSLSYRAPDWSPDGRRFAFVGIPNGDAALMVAAADGANPKTLAPAPNVSAFAWSPRGDFIAFASTLAPNLTIFDRVTLVEPEDGASRVLAEGPIIAFFWSPGGDRLALMRLSDQGTHLILSVVDVKTGAGLDVAEFLPSQELQFMLSFFDQYKESHRIWSPDGRFLALSGVLAGDDPGAESQVYVVDASGGVPPRAVAAGTLAFWPPAGAASGGSGGPVQLSIMP